MLQLAAPVALAELGWMAMGTVDTIMIGNLGPAAIGATGVGSSVYYTLAIFGMGLQLGLDTLVSQAHGAGDKADTHHSLAQGVYAALFVAVPLTLLFLWSGPVFLWLGINPEVSGLAAQFVTTLAWGTLPLLLYGAFRRYLQAISHVRPVMFALISANLINWLCNWLLIYGNWGLPKLGVVGSALSTCLARVYMAATLLFFIWWFERGNEQGFRQHFATAGSAPAFALDGARFTGGYADSDGDRCVWCGSGTCGTIIARGVSRTSDCIELRGGQLYGAAGRFVGSGGGGRPSDWARQSRGSPAHGLYGGRFRLRVYGLFGGALLIDSADNSRDLYR